MEMDFKKRLKQLRKENGLTQDGFAKKMATTRSTIAGYESEGKEPDYDTLKAFAKFFNVSIDYLLGNTNIRTSYETEIETLAAHHDGEEWTEEELEDLEMFKELIRKRREKKK